MIQCSKCNMQYIGETKRHLSDRFGEHRRIIEKAIQRRHINQLTAVSDHFSFPGHSINNIELIPLEPGAGSCLELIKSNRDGIRKAKEARPLNPMELTDAMKLNLCENFTYWWLLYTFILFTFV